MSQIARVFGQGVAGRAVSAIALGWVANVSGAWAADTDTDGCWSGYHPDGGSCVEFRAEQRDTRTYLQFNNRCDSRLFLTWCAADKCGSDSLRAGQSKSQYVYADGSKAKVFAVGSKRASKDHICQERLGRW